MIEFVLNNQPIQTESPAFLPLLDFIRYEQRLTGAKAACREGDCGACLALEGRLENGQMHYQSIASCLMPLGNAQGKHIVTIEGLNRKGLSPVQQGIVDHSATQCGFCTPGIIVALTALCLSEEPLTEQRAMAALDGNLCRCTGYQSLKQAVLSVLSKLPAEQAARPIPWLIDKGYLPVYFSGITEQVAQIPRCAPAFHPGRPILGGGTDLLAQQPDQLRTAEPSLLCERWELSGIYLEGNSCTIGSGLTMAEILRNPDLNRLLPGLEEYGRLIASTPIRNMGTLGGNLANASPIADLVIIFLALDTTVLLNGPHGRRELPLDGFYLGYKKTDMRPDEYLEGIRFQIPSPGHIFNFEKVSKRARLDIASVNTAIGLELKSGAITLARISAGGVSPVPLFLRRTSEFLKGKLISDKVLAGASQLIQEEISPISDIRGSAEYKRLLLRQLFYAHFLKHFPEQLSLKGLLNEGRKLDEKHRLERTRKGAIHFPG